MYINWQGIKEFLGWKGTTEELKRLELPEYVPDSSPTNPGEEPMKKNAGFKGGITKTVEVPEQPENDLPIRHVPLPSNGGVREAVEVENFDGFKMIHLNADEETKIILSKNGIVTPFEDEDLYRFRIQEGDYVRLPDGRKGTVRMIEYGMGGYEKIVSVDVDGAPRRWFGLRAALPACFADGEIVYLKLIATQEELAKI